MAAELAGGEPAESPVLIAEAGQVVALLWIRDSVRPDAGVNLRVLRDRGFELHLLSGDREEVAFTVAAELSQETNCSSLFASVIAEVTPEEKLARVRELSSGSRILVMVGDGVNDAGALAAADVGVAVKGAAEAARMSADVYLSESGVRQLRELLEGSERVLNTIRRGIAFSLLYNVVGISAAALGLLGPLWAAVLMPLSSLTVVTNAFRSKMFRGEGER
jgi:Cu2+-exporting ATPase